MADTKVTALTALTGANTVPADVLLIVDVSDNTMAASGTTKSITREELGTFAGTLAGTATTLNVNKWDATVPSTCTAALYGSNSTLKTAAAAFTLTKMAHYSALSGTKGAGSTITTAYGFEARNAFAVASTNYAFYSDVAAASNTYQLYMGGTAPSYFGGPVGVVGTNADALFRVGGGSGEHPSTAVTLYGAQVDYTVPATATTSARAYQSAIRTAASAFTLSVLYHFYVGSATKGAGSTVTSTMAFAVENAFAIATNNYAFYSAVNSAATTYQLYMSGTALNFLKGGVILDTTAAPTVAASQVGLGATVQTTVGAAGAASALPAQPTGYWIINVAGTNRVVPYYTAS